MEGLGFDNILGEQEIETLFTSPESDASKGSEDPKEAEEPSSEPNTEDENKDKNKTTEVVDPNELFEEEKQPESVGSGKNTEGGKKEDTQADEGSGASPNDNFYSSIANALAVDGIFPNLTEEDVKKASTAEDLSELIDAEVNARLDDRQRRIVQALDNGVEPTDIKKYENTLSFLSSITDEQLVDEGEKGEQLRRSLIYQDFINRGMSPDKAQKYTNRTIDAGTDIEDAKEALQSNKDFFQGSYHSLLEEAQAQEEAEKQEREKQADNLKSSILQDKQLMGDLELSNDIRKRTLENITRPIYRDPETNTYLTALQKYEAEHRADFLKYVGLVYTLTDGFKDFESFTKGKVKKEVRKGLRELEHTLNNTNRDASGNLRMVNNVKDDPYSYLGRGVKLDL